jgi:DNA polymerase III delta subunit
MPGKLIIVSGNDEFLVKERAGEIVRKLCGDPPESNESLEIIDGGVDPDKNEEVLSVFERLAGTMLTPPFLTPEKFVWLKHFSAFSNCQADTERHKRKKAALERLAESIKSGLPDYLTLLIDGIGIDRRKAFFKICDKAAKSSGELHWIDVADPTRDRKGFAANLGRRIRELVDNNGMRMDPDAMAYIADTVGGSDGGRLKSEIDKVCCYAMGRPAVTLRDCVEICSRTPEAVSWEFTGALIERDAAKAISIIPALVESISAEGGSSSRPEILIVSTAAAEFKRLAAIKCEGARFGVPRHASPDYFSNLIASNKAEHPGNPLLSMHPFRAFKLWSGALKFSDAELADALDAIFSANKAIVTGGDPRRILEDMALRIAASR